MPTICFLSNFLRSLFRDLGAVYMEKGWPRDPPPTPPPPIPSHSKVLYTSLQTFRDWMEGPIPREYEALRSYSPARTISGLILGPHLRLTGEKPGAHYPLLMGSWPHLTARTWVCSSTIQWPVCTVSPVAKECMGNFSNKIHQRNRLYSSRFIPSVIHGPAWPN